MEAWAYIIAGFVLLAITSFDPLAINIDDMPPEDES